jgi:hypothetical protein
MTEVSATTHRSRRLSCDPAGNASAAQPVYLHRGGLGFIAPPGAYASVPAWHNAGAWLGALKVHPRLVEACARRVKPALFLTIMREFAGRADPATGRDIAVVHADIAAAVGVCTKTIQRAVSIAYSLGAMQLVLAGCDMSINQRDHVLRRYGRGLGQRSWRNLPNFYAATMPAEMAKLAQEARADVDNKPRRMSVVHHPEGSPPPTKRSVDLHERRTFSPACGQPSLPQPQRPRRTAAARPTDKQHQKADVSRWPRLEPELEAYAAALRARLPGYQRLSLRRIGPALRQYLHAGLKPAELTAGLNTYLQAHSTTWITTWPPDTQAEQARYLIGMLTKARQAGYITPDPY